MNNSKISTPHNGWAVKYDTIERFNDSHRIYFHNFSDNSSHLLGIIITDFFSTPTGKMIPIPVALEEIGRLLKLQKRRSLTIDESATMLFCFSCYLRQTRSFSIYSQMFPVDKPTDYLINIYPISNQNNLSFSLIAMQPSCDILKLTNFVEIAKTKHQYDLTNNPHYFR